MAEAHAAVVKAEAANAQADLSSSEALIAHLKLENEAEAKQLTIRLGEIYEQDGSPLEVRHMPEDRVVIQLKTDYTKEARKFSIRPLLTAGPLQPG